MNNDFNFYYLSFLANLCQLDSWQMNNKSLTNEHLLKYLQHQDNDYLKKIIEQNNEIIKQNKEIISYLKK